jgi:nitroimidazol reductase NimA-like FMN-containing flavoprotein (pyridoxamine 5'-phosphate oxidase superfamily)
MKLNKPLRRHQMKVPDYIKKILNDYELCTMATCWQNKPYLSLMTFTYIESENKIVLTTKKDSKKFFNIEKNKNISILIFSEVDELSVTLLGTAKLLTGEKEAYYRAIHMEANNRPQFILGEAIGLILFSIEEIVVSNNKDEVKYY